MLATWGTIKCLKNTVDWRRLHSSGLQHGVRVALGVRGDMLGVSENILWSM
jgi:hypothetical protein